MTADRRDGSDGSDGDPRRSAAGLSRRKLLAGLGGLGAVGMASGAGTAAYLSDRETFRGNTFAAGAVDIELSFESPCPGCVVSDDGGASFAFDDIHRGDSGQIVLSVNVQTNPARLWLGTGCPPASDSLDLGEAIEATLTVGDFSRSGSLFDLRREFGGGLRLDDLDGDACLDPADGPIEVALSWNLPDEAPDETARSETSFDVQLYAEQCRHVSEAAASNPFAGLDCDEPDEPDNPEECPNCEVFGKADDIDGELSIGDEIGLSELSSGVGPHSIVVTDVEYKDGDEAVGLAFRLVDEGDNPGPDICTVAIKGGRDTKSYEITPPHSVIDEVLTAPESSGIEGSGLAGVSNVIISVCVDNESEPSAKPSKKGEKRHGPQREPGSLNEPGVPANKSRNQPVETDGDDL